MKKKGCLFLKGFFIFLVVVLVLLGGAGFLVGKMLHEKLNYQECEAVAEEPFKVDGVKNILLIGNDSRMEDETGRSDAMILVSISDRTHSIHFTSLMRDIYVEIPGHEGNRLNAAYAFGGPELLMETLEYNFDIEVSRYVLVNFEAFTNLVDAVGGVTVELTNEEVHYINGHLASYNKSENRPEGTDYLDTSLSGEIHLNGSQALAFCRNRLVGSDFARTERQRKVLVAAAKNAPDVLWENGSELIDVVMSNITTNLTSDEIVGLIMQSPLMVCYKMVSARIPLSGTCQDAVIRKMAVLEVDFEANKEYIRREIYGEK